MLQHIWCCLSQYCMSVSVCVCVLSAKCTLGCLKQKRIIFIHMGALYVMRAYTPFNVCKTQVQLLLYFQYPLCIVLYKYIYTAPARNINSTPCYTKLWEPSILWSWINVIQYRYLTIYVYMFIFLYFIPCGKWWELMYAEWQAQCLYVYAAWKVYFRIDVKNVNFHYLFSPYIKFI